MIDYREDGSYIDEQNALAQLKAAHRMIARQYFEARGVIWSGIPDWKLERIGKHIVDDGGKR